MNIEIIGITTCGTYPSWLDYTIASFYNHVDKVIVTNAGYDINHPELGAVVPLKKEHELIQEIDINKKIIELNPTKEQIENIFNIRCKQGKDEFGRSTNMTLSTQAAYNLPNNNKERWILKLDSDQILYQIKREQLEELIRIYPNKTGFRFAQYADYYQDFKHIGGGVPNEFTNDGSLFYKALPNQGYCGQGSPGYINVDQYPIESIRTSHMRRINPPNTTPHEYHYKRLWYHTYAPDSIMEHWYNRQTNQHLTNEQLRELVHKETLSTIIGKGEEIDKIPYNEKIPYHPPLVCTMSPLEYIKQDL